MNLSKGRRFVTLAFGFAIAIPVLGPAARGDAMGPWNGASASTTVFDQNASQQGATAAASGSETQSFEYVGSSGYPPGLYHIPVSGSASAIATGRPDQILSIQSQYQTPNPGKLGPPFGTPGEVRASASWTNDAVILTPPVGGTLPDSVRLQFALTVAPQTPANYYSPYYDVPEQHFSSFGTIQLRANNQSYTVGPWMASQVGDRSSSAFDSVTTYPASATAIPTLDPVTKLPGVIRSIGTFHLDLPLSASGVSDPFHLTLESRLSTGLAQSSAIKIYHNAVLALTDVTLPDGTSLISKGYGVTFESGMPSPVPEPTSLACWGLVASAAGWVGRRRLRTNK